MLKKKMFYEIAGGQKFLEPKSNQLCRKLCNEYKLHNAREEVKETTADKHSDDKEGFSFVNSLYFNAIVENTGFIVYVPEKRKVLIVD